MVDKNTILEAINKLGIGGESICIHSSLKSFGYVENGAETVVQAFLDAECTILIPAFCDMFEVFPPKNLCPERNGAGDYSYFENQKYDDNKIFTIDCNDITKEDMGAIPYTVVNMPNRKRGYNPLNSFAAVGKYANELVQEQSAENVWAPLQKLCEYRGYVLLMGVNLDNATIIHYAEQVAGREPFIRWANNLKGEPSTISVGSCSNGFNNFADILKPIEMNTTVENSYWRCFPAKDMVEICASAIRKNPEITHCRNPKCERCNDAILGGPIW